MNKTLDLVKLYQKLSKAKTRGLGELNVVTGSFHVKEGEISMSDGDCFGWVTFCDIDSLDVQGDDKPTPEEALRTLQTHCKECKEYRVGCWKH